MNFNPANSGPQAQALMKRDFAALSPSYKREYPLVVDRASGSEIWDVDGKRYIDFMAGVAVMNVGHVHPYITQRVEQQLKEFWHICLSDFYYPQAVELAEKLQAIAPMDDTLVYFGNSGTEAVEAAIKLATYHTRRRKFVGFLGAFHGRTLGSLSFTASKNVQRARYHMGVPVYHVPYPDSYRPLLATTNGADYGEQLANYIEHEIFRTILDPRDVAAFMIEPIQGEGGYIVPTQGFFARLRDICDRYGILLIVDEIQSGAGRTGKWWAIEYESVKPDIVCFAKGIGSGFPIGGIIARKDVMTWKAGSHGSTFGGNPIAAIAALATLETIEQEGILGQAFESGARIMSSLNAMASDHQSIGDIRGRGLMLGIEFVKNRDTKERATELRNMVVQKAFESGLLLLPCGPNSIRMTPPLNIDEQLIDEGLEVFEHVLSETENTLL